MTYPLSSLLNSLYIKDLKTSVIVHTYKEGTPIHTIQTGETHTAYTTLRTPSGEYKTYKQESETDILAHKRLVEQLTLHEPYLFKTVARRNVSDFIRFWSNHLYPVQITQTFRSTSNTLSSQVTPEEQRVHTIVDLGYSTAGDSAKDSSESRWRALNKSISLITDSEWSDIYRYLDNSYLLSQHRIYCTHTCKCPPMILGCFPVP